MADGFDAATLESLLRDLSRFSAPGPGVTRLAYDEAWCRAHAWLAAEAATRGLAATADAAGNLFFHDPATRAGERTRPVLMTGSHLDTVRAGGRFDGAYGAVAGLMLAARHRGRTGVPVVGFVTCEEEQSRFDSHMMGARAMLGQVTAAELDRVRDDRGVSWREALAAVHARGRAAALDPGPRPIPTLFHPAAVLELHIEQGPELEAEALALGIVEHIAGYRRLAVTVTGEARHSGTTPRPRRRDALAASAAIVLAIERLNEDFGAAARATVGHVRVEPGLYNVVAGACELWVEVRHVESRELERLALAAHDACVLIGAERGVRVVVGERTRQEPTALSPRLAAVAEALARAHGLPHRRMPSGAAHDTMEFARAGREALMLFVPSRGGISHAPDEHTDTAELWAGVEFASALLERLAAEPG